MEQHRIKPAISLILLKWRKKRGSNSIEHTEWLEEFETSFFLWMVLYIAVLLKLFHVQRICYSSIFAWHYLPNFFDSFLIGLTDCLLFKMWYSFLSTSNVCVLVWPFICSCLLFCCVAFCSESSILPVEFLFTCSHSLSNTLPFSPFPSFFVCSLSRIWKINWTIW